MSERSVCGQINCKLHRQARTWCFTYKCIYPKYENKGTEGFPPTRIKNMTKRVAPKELCSTQMYVQFYLLCMLCYLIKLRNFCAICHLFAISSFHFEQQFYFCIRTFSKSMNATNIQPLSGKDFVFQTVHLDSGMTCIVLYFLQTNSDLRMN